MDSFGSRSKRRRDFDVGKKAREHVVEFLQNLLDECGLVVCFAEDASHVIDIDVIYEDGKFGLDCLICKGDICIRVIIRFFENELYYKLRGIRRDDSREAREENAKIVAEFESRLSKFYVLVINSDVLVKGITHYAIANIGDLMKYGYRGVLGTGENYNRWVLRTRNINHPLHLGGSLPKIPVNGEHKPRFFGYLSSLKDELLKIMKDEEKKHYDRPI